MNSPTQDPARIAPPSPRKADSSAPREIPGFPHEALDRLACLVHRGDVVFFVGAGFSLDSEQNTASRLVKRLLVRLEALGALLDPQGRSIRDDLRPTFELGTFSPPSTSAQGANPAPEPIRFPYGENDIRELGRRYYETNDWFCKAFARCLALIAAMSETRLGTWLTRLHQAEEQIRTAPGGHFTGEIDSVPLDIEPVAHLAGWLREGDRLHHPSHRAAAGKALFLATMGFHDPRIMAGNPRADDIPTVAASYGQRLRARHHVLARFARDGLCTTTITTNFDLLLEGAFRLSGFERSDSRRGHDSAGGRVRRARDGTFSIPPTRFAEFARIASPLEFFREGKPHRTAVLIKMHGCADAFRESLPSRASSRRDGDRMEPDLKSMVFTYREIQNWRDDAWAADYLRTLLRTRTVVFAGYSIQDPVIHDTFRNVYEEMARRPDGNEDASEESDWESLKRAPAFFLDIHDPEPPGRKPFHAGEVLHAASAAVGAARDSHEVHPNFIHFHLRNARGGFPHLDEVFRWLYHRVLRCRQEECLRNDLQRTLIALHGRSRPEAELHRARRLFEVLCRSEQRVARKWASRPRTPDAQSRCRRQLSRVCSWSRSFHVGLLRELAVVEHLRQMNGWSLELARNRRLGWYYPIMEDAGWICWGALVELAIRRMIASALGEGLAQVRDPGAAWAADSDRPTLLFAPSGRRDSSPVLRALAIRFGDLHQTDAALEAFHQPVHTTVWLLRDHDTPWRATEWNDRLTSEYSRDRSPALVTPVTERPSRTATGLQARRAPPAQIVWRWASGTESAEDRVQARGWLGIHDLGA